MLVGNLDALLYNVSVQDSVQDNVQDEVNIYGTISPSIYNNK